MRGKTTPGPVNSVSPQLQTRIDALRGRSDAFAPRVNAYLDAQDQIAGANMNTIGALGDYAAQQNIRTPFPVMGHARNMSVNDQQKMRAMTDEATRQMRLDLRAGRTSAFIDPNDHANTANAAEVKATMAARHGLREAGVPQDFGKHSPKNVDEVRQLQRLNEGQMPKPGEDAGFTALGRRFEHMSDARRDREINGMIKSQRVPPGLGIESGTPNARDIPKTLNQLTGERDAINAQLKKLGRDPVAIKSLDQATQRLQQLDDAIANHGKSLHDRYSSLKSPVTEPTFQKAPVLDSTDNGQLRRVPFVDGEGSRLGEAIMPSRFGGQPNLTAGQKDELVRVNDSLNLLQGNQSGLSIKDVPMSEGLANALGVDPSVRGTPVDPNDPLQVFKKPQFRMSNTEKVDRAALKPVEERSKYLRDLSTNIYGQGLAEKSHTEFNSWRENTFMNRAAEAIDPFSYVFQRDKKDWIAGRAELRNQQATNIEKKVSGLTSDASTDASYGRHGDAMGKLRQTTYPLDFHRGINGDYDARIRDTEFRTGLTIAMAPLSVIPIAQGAAKGGRALASAGRKLATSAARRAPIGTIRRNVARGFSSQLKSLGGTGNAVIPNSRRVANVSRQAAQGTRTAAQGGRGTAQGARNAALNQAADINQTLAIPHNKSFADDVFRSGQTVNVQRSSGAIDKGWQIGNVTDDGLVVVTNKAGLKKQVYGADLIEHNPALLKNGREVRVLRSNGKLENGWTVGQRSAGNVRVHGPGGVYKDVPLDDIIKHNYPRPPAANKIAKVDGAALKQSQQYQKTHRLNGPIEDGFADGGRGMKVSEGGTAQSSREVIVVDRARDANLQNHLKYARSLRELPEAARAEKIADYVADVMTTKHPNWNAASGNWLDTYAGREVLLGDVPAAGGGVCRHNSLMYKVLADEAGLQTTMVRGFAGDDLAELGGHAWAEVMAGGERKIVEIGNRAGGRIVNRGDGGWYWNMNRQPYY